MGDGVCEWTDAGASDMTAEAGAPAPDFTLADENEAEFSLSALRGERVVLVFYPGDDTPVCTRQLCDYRDGLEQFQDLGARVIGISRDDPASHRRFQAQYGLPFTLLSDPDLAVAKAYGAAGTLGMKRAVFLIDEAGIIRYAHVESLALFRRRREELIKELQRLEE